jgi:DNA segregation ATPase FtsK/SpoIIIE-like protein
MMNIEQEIQNILDRNFTRGDNANALKELLVLYNAVEQSEQLKAFVDWWHGLSQEELAWYEGRYVEVFLSL